MEAPKIVTLFKFLLMIARNGNCMSISADAQFVHCFDLGNNQWRVDLKVYDFKGVGRFYFGLADCIQILKGEEFRQWVEEFATENIPHYANSDSLDCIG